MDTGTGQVHIAPGHGADDYLAGMQHGLPILSPVDDDGRFTEEVGVPVWAGQICLRCEQGSRRASARERRAAGRAEFTSTLIRIAGARKRRSSSAPSSSSSSASTTIRGRRRWRRSTRCTWIPHWGRNRIYGHRGIAAGLVHLAPAHLGRAAAGLLRCERASRSSTPRIARKVADLVETARHESLVREGRRVVGAARSACPPAPRAATTRSMSGSIPASRTRGARARIPSCGCAGRCLYRSHRSASRLVPVFADDQRRARWRGAVQDA